MIFTVPLFIAFCIFLVISPFKMVCDSFIAHSNVYSTFTEIGGPRYGAGTNVISDN